MTTVGRLHGARPTIVAALVTLIGLVTLAAPAAASAWDAGPTLVLRPVGQAGTYFDLTMRPGQTRRLEVEIGSVAGIRVTARTYPADVYTIVNGGFGARLRDEPTSGMTRWLDYEPSDLDLVAGDLIRRSFVVSVPTDAGPGEYISSIVLESDQPIAGDGMVTLGQVVRQAIAVVINVPGRPSPGLAIGNGTHTVVAGRSTVSIGIENTGNLRLKPFATFTLFDAGGAPVSEAGFPLDTLYASTATSFEVPLAARLRPGTYVAHVTLVDATRDVRATDDTVTITVEAPVAVTTLGGAVPGLTEVTQGPFGGEATLPILIVALGATLLVVVTSLLVVPRMRRARRS